MWDALVYLTYAAELAAMDGFTLFVLTKSRDPRRVGGTYWCGYWGEDYTVLGIRASAYGVLHFHIVWADDGREVTHCTTWDMWFDRVINYDG